MQIRSQKKKENEEEKKEESIRETIVEKSVIYCGKQTKLG
jgi:hypothetical protein